MLTLTVDSRLVLRVRQECVCKVAIVSIAFEGNHCQRLRTILNYFLVFFISSLVIHKMETFHKKDVSDTK